ncbi:MAG: Alpha-pyrone synthesis polyketide synthase-like Pks18 [Verrucomicrobiae bacterium]|nr:Alpha-pyrone synthesis polyketide synthase-like Pks18 [Verrucomicrobiae bacterium]
MSAYIHHIETLVPETFCRQDYIRDRMMEWSGNPRTARYIRAVYDRSGIAKRHSVLPDFQRGVPTELFHDDALEPSTAERNRCYIRYARELSVEIARRALSGFSPADVTHVVTASCTGFYNPGMDYDIVVGLGLPPTVERYNLGFMGCYAAMPALRMAEQFCRANPRAVVLVVCLELCTLHFQLRDNPDNILANALFADGVAAAVVSARAPAGHAPVLRLGEFLPALATEGGGDMAWEVGNTGFNIVLSSYVPDIIAGSIGPIVDNILARRGRQRGEIDRWAIHPGGKSILDKLERCLLLEPSQLQQSRDVLRDFGNMSSATILFVLRRILDTLTPGHAEQICAMAFGPGLTIETALLEAVPAAKPEPVLVEV